MTDIQPYSPPPAPVPTAASGIIEWAQSADAAYSLAQRLVSTSFCPQAFRGKPEEAAAAILSGAEVNLSPMASLRAFDVIQGTAAPKALTQRAVAQSFGHEIVLVESTPLKCIVRGKRRGSSEWQQVEWTMARATQLGVTGKPNWKSQPQAMLLARATGEMARLIAADALLGIGYNAEEIEDSEPAPTTTVTRDPSATRKVARKKPEPVAVEEPEFDEPATEERPAEEPATRPQVTALNAAVTARGIAERDAKLAFLSGQVGRELSSSSDLTKDEASKVLDALTAEPAPADEPDVIEGWEQ